MRLNLRRTKLTSGIFLHHPEDERAETMEIRVQLLGVIGGRRIPAPKLHRCGYQAAPYVFAPLCSDGGGPYGRQVWIRRGRALGTVGRQRIEICEECERLEERRRAQ